MHGPFSRALNAAILEQYRIRWMVTKDGGAAGGFGEKLDAARDAGAELVVIGRRRRRGTAWRLYWPGCWKPGLKRRNEHGSDPHRHGAGGPSALTGGALTALERADVLIGSRRLVEGCTLAPEAQPVLFHKIR